MKNNKIPKGSLSKGIFIGLIFWYIMLIIFIIIDSKSEFIDLIEKV